MKTRILLTFVLGGLFLVHAAGQSDLDLQKLDERFSEYLSVKMPGWKHKRGEPIQGSKGVLIEFWSSSNRIVKISVGSANSAKEAQGIVDRFVQYDKEKEELKGLGDRAYAWGYSLSNVVVVRGKFIVHVSTYADVDSDSDARLLSQSERSGREASEMRRLSREFAKHTVGAIDAP